MGLRRSRRARKAGRLTAIAIELALLAAAAAGFVATAIGVAASWFVP